MPEKGHEGDVRPKLVGGLILVGMGCLFLLTNLGILPNLHVLWPVFLIIVGVAIIVGNLSGRRQPPSGP
jgi:hypothetical protein